MTTTLLKTFVVLIVAACLASGCALSRSISKSVSKSVRTISESSSDLFSDTSAKALYDSDIKEATCLFAGSHQTSDQYLRLLSSIASEYGITDWEQDATTYHAIGAGLRKAGYSADDVLNSTFMQPLLTKPDRVQHILAGYSL